MSSAVARSPGLREVLHLNCVPHFTTLQKASRHLLTSAPVGRVLESTIRLHYGRRQRIQSSAVDSTGLECTAASGYFVAAPPTRLVALENRSLSSLSEARPGMRHELPLHPLDSRRSRSAARCGRAGAAATDAVRSVLIDCLAADAGYDSESNHRFARSGAVCGP